ncbi:hypothetical protein NPIL_69171 [Nephila pilipes]|uniref:Uncharacterized protein n=1 Tax=Nephila pilipes TaxID=299642 RepID=A0A8X6UFZ8_NEPPI|nr:hypothetical protein NPIL_69171 [Nephila pilipes]
MVATSMELHVDPTPDSCCSSQYLCNTVSPPIINPEAYGSLVGVQNWRFKSKVKDVDPVPVLAMNVKKLLHLLKRESIST